MDDSMYENNVDVRYCSSKISEHPYPQHKNQPAENLYGKHKLIIIYIFTKVSSLFFTCNIQ